MPFLQNYGIAVIFQGKPAEKQRGRLDKNEFLC